MLPALRFRPGFVCACCFVAITLLTGCPHAGMSYSLVDAPSGAIVLPPKLTPAAIGSDLNVTIKNARKKAPSDQSCDISEGPLSVGWQGRNAKVHLKFETYEARDQKLAPGQVGPALFVNPLQEIEAIRTDVRKLETNGCLAPGESSLFLRALTQHLPLPPDIESELLYGDLGFTGVHELSPDFRLQIGSPIYAKNADGGADQFVAYENAYYVFKPSPKDGRVQISLASVTQTPFRKSAVEVEKSQNGISFPQGFGYFRFLLRDRTDLNSNASVASVLFAQQPAPLDEVTAEWRKTSADPCATPAASKLTCISIPAKDAVNLEPRFIINGKVVFGCPPGGCFGNSPENLKTLQIRRMYEGHMITITFDPARQTFRRFTLLPGDEISWH
jgi:hypothetical protein